MYVADGGGASRRRMSGAALMEQFADADGASAALDAFVRARLVTMDSDTVVITHEALLQAWPRLRDWIHADRAGLLLHQQLTHAAVEWEREGRDPSALYRGTRLSTVRAWADELDGRRRLGPGEEAFLHASIAEQRRHERQAGRQVRLRQTMLATLVVLLGLALTAGGLAYQQRESALDQERVARSQALAVRSASLAGGRPEASMLLAGEAYRAHATAEARGALLSTQSQPFLARLSGHRGPVNTVAFAPGDRLLATGSTDGTVTVRRVSDHRRTATFAVSGPVRSIAFSPDGRTLAATSAHGPVSLWDVAGHRRKAVLGPGTEAARALSFDPRGNRLAVATVDGVIEVWDTADTPRVTATLEGHVGAVNALDHAPGGRTLVSAGADRTVRLWDTDRGRQSDVLEDTPTRCWAWRSPRTAGRSPPAASTGPYGCGTYAPDGSPRHCPAAATTSTPWRTRTREVRSSARSATARPGCGTSAAAVRPPSSPATPTM
ncbi:hypothetical protein SHKM778_36370 [Streptomyces sp. KM77-8]|uniref:Novel STAND NTPase 1 domain-containing protein n=1 Tax=Streptomyces haneummycinicus TaxID=3074435 RepID=A0AAT9HIX1_9ACTN